MNRPRIIDQLSACTVCRHGSLSDDSDAPVSLEARASAHCWSPDVVGRSGVPVPCLEARADTGACGPEARCMTFDLDPIVARAS